MSVQPSILQTLMKKDRVSVGDKSKNTWTKTSSDVVVSTNTAESKCMNPHYSLCDFHGHTTHKCSEILVFCIHLCNLDEDNKLLVVKLFDVTSWRNKSLHPNQACALCGIYGH